MAYMSRSLYGCHVCQCIAKGQLNEGNWKGTNRAVGLTLFLCSLRTRTQSLTRRKANQNIENRNTQKMDIIKDGEHSKHHLLNMS